MNVNFRFLEEIIGENGSPTFTLPDVKVLLSEKNIFKISELTT